MEEFKSHKFELEKEYRWIEMKEKGMQVKYLAFGEQVD